MGDEFVGEKIEPVRAQTLTRRMAAGEPGIPRRFVWRGREYTVRRILETWKTTGPCRSGSDERYVRRHWYRVRTTEGPEMKIYFERQPRSSRERAVRWWIYTIKRES
jgi:phosphoribosylglycinamide formyltransferase-1